MVERDFAHSPNVLQNPPGMVLFFRDEFDGSTLNTARWHREASTYGAPARIQRYRPENVVVSGGTLKLISKREFYIDRDFTAGMVSTRALGVYYPRFGRYEIRCRVPHGQGVWPAFWLRHRDGSSVCEVDIFEYFHVYNPGRANHALHRTNNTGTFQTNVTAGDAPFEGTSVAPGWHRFAVDMVPEGAAVRFRFEVDGRVGKSFLDTSATNWSSRYDADAFDITLQGSQIGGDYAGHPDDPLGYNRYAAGGAGACAIGGTPPDGCTITELGQDVKRAVFPNTFEVDYVRVWRWVG